MGGPAAFAGPDFQARVVALAYVHVLAKWQLGWLSPTDDRPMAISGETGGPGDDIRLDFGERRSPVEVQAKHGLVGFRALHQALVEIHARLVGSTPAEVVLAVDPTSSRLIRVDLANELRQLQTGRTDRPHPTVDRLLKESPELRVVLDGLKVIALDLDYDSSATLQHAQYMLGSLLKDSNQAGAAWAIFVADAVQICSQRLRRTKDDLEQLLTSRGVALTSVDADEYWHRLLDSARDLIRSRRTQAALQLLTHIQIEIGEQPAAPVVRGRIFALLGAVSLTRSRPDEAITLLRRALEFAPQDPKTLLNLGRAFAFKRSYMEAIEFIQQALTFQAEWPDGWALLAQVRRDAGLSEPQPPPNVIDTREYQGALASIAVSEGRWGDALEITRKALAQGPRPPELLLDRSTALTNGSLVDVTGAREDALREAERLASEALEKTSGEDDPRFLRALSIRAQVRRNLADHEGADADVSTLDALQATNPTAIQQRAMRLEDSNQLEAAIELLNENEAENVPELLVHRGRLKAAARDRAGALEDIEAAASKAAGSANKGLVEQQAAEVALRIGKLEFAESLINSSAASGQPAMDRLLRGRLHALRDDLDKATVHFKAAAELVGEAKKGELLAELASRLVEANREEVAVEILEQLGGLDLSGDSLKLYARALLQTNDLTKVGELLDHSTRRGDHSRWLLELGAMLAERREDPDTEIRFLRTLVEQSGASQTARLRLAELLTETGARDEALTLTYAIAEERTLSAFEQMQAAQLLSLLGRSEEAVTLAFKAYRFGRHHGGITRAFIMLVLASEQSTPVTVATVQPDTYVRLSSRGADPIEYTIFADSPADPLRGEYLHSDLAVSDLIGRKRGEIVVRHSGHWTERSYRVAKIQPVLVHAFQDALLKYEARFPTEPWIQLHHVGRRPTLRSLATMLALVHPQQRASETIFAAYMSQVLPLGAVASALRLSIPEAMRKLTSRSDPRHCLFVEWTDEAGQAESRSAAIEARQVVLTRSALETIERFGLFEHLRTLSLIAPFSLKRELEHEIAELERLAAEGRTMLREQDNTLGIVEIQPGVVSPILARRRGLLNWVTEAVRFEYRPLSTIEPLGSEEEEQRRLVGRSSYDALALARHLEASIYADDLGLRRLAQLTSAGRSFSTVVLLDHLAATGALTPEIKNSTLLSMAVARYVAIPPSAELLTFGVSHVGEEGRDLDTTFRLLTDSDLVLVTATEVVASVVRNVVLAPVRYTQVTEIVIAAVGALRARWPLPAIVYYLRTSARRSLALLPNDLQEIERVLDRYFS